MPASWSPTAAPTTRPTVPAVPGARTIRCRDLTTFAAAWNGRWPDEHAAADDQPAAADRTTRDAGAQAVLAALLVAGDGVDGRVPCGVRQLDVHRVRLRRCARRRSGQRRRGMEAAARRRGGRGTLAVVGFGLAGIVVAGGPASFFDGLTKGWATVVSVTQPADLTAELRDRAVRPRLARCVDRLRGGPPRPPAGGADRRSARHDRPDRAAQRRGARRRPRPGRASSPRWASPSASSSSGGCVGRARRSASAVAAGCCGGCRRP